jgi:hypothetical protein
MNQTDKLIRILLIDIHKIPDVANELKVMRAFWQKKYERKRMIWKTPKN